LPIDGLCSGCDEYAGPISRDALELEYISADYLHASVTIEELEKVLKLTKNGKTSGQDNINSELYKYAPKV